MNRNGFFLGFHQVHITPVHQSGQFIMNRNIRMPCIMHRIVILFQFEAPLVETALYIQQARIQGVF